MQSSKGGESYHTACNIAIERFAILCNVATGASVAPDTPRKDHLLDDRSVHLSEFVLSPRHS